MHSVRRRLAALAACLVVGAVLTGCIKQDPKPTPTPTASATPLYSSDEEALAAAKEAHARYVKVSNEVAQAGWIDLSPLKTVETGDALRVDSRVGQGNNAQGLKSVGDAVGRVVRIQQITNDAVTAYACVDVGGTSLIDASGTDRTPPNRADIYSFQVRFVARDDELVVERNDRWSGKSFC